MKLIVLKTNLKDGLSAVERGVTESATLPILKNVLIKTFNNKIKIAATNLELGITKFISGKIIEEGSITVPFSILYKIINNSDSERIHLEVDNNNLIVKTDNYEAKIQGITAEEYPIIPKVENQEYLLEIPCDTLKKSLLKVIPCCQLSEIRPEISGILFDFQMTLLKIVATDSFRLAEKTIHANQFKSNFVKGFKSIIPLKTIQEFIRVFPDTDSVKIIIDANQICFQNNDIELISRLIDGEYPDYEQIIPKDIETETQISRDYLLNATKLVSNFSGKVNDIRIKQGENKKMMEVYSSSQYLGENKYLIPAKIKGKDFNEINFNWRFLLDGIRIMESENIIFGINGESRPSMLKTPDDASYFYILMPIKV